MRAGVYMARLGHEVGLFTPSRNPELHQHPGVIFARVYRVRWRR